MKNQSYILQCSLKRRIAVGKNEFLKLDVLYTLLIVNVFLIEAMLLSTQGTFSLQNVFHFRNRSCISRPVNLSAAARLNFVLDTHSYTNRQSRKHSVVLMNMHDWSSPEHFKSKYNFFFKLVFRASLPPLLPSDLHAMYTCNQMV